jgi:hypothetical protein
MIGHQTNSKPIQNHEGEISPCGSLSCEPGGTNENQCICFK